MCDVVDPTIYVYDATASVPEIRDLSDANDWMKKDVEVGKEYVITNPETNNINKKSNGKFCYTVEPKNLAAILEDTSDTLTNPKGKFTFRPLLAGTCYITTTQMPELKDAGMYTGTLGFKKSRSQKTEVKIVAAPTGSTVLPTAVSNTTTPISQPSSTPTPLHAELNITIGVTSNDTYGEQLTYNIATKDTDSKYTAKGVLNKNTESEFNKAVADGIADIKTIKDFENLYNKITEGGPAITLFESLGGAIPTALQVKTMIAQYNDWKDNGENKFIAGYKGFAEKVGYKISDKHDTTTLFNFCEAAIKNNEVTTWQNNRPDMLTAYNKFKAAMKEENDKKSNLRAKAATASVVAVPAAAVGAVGLGLYKAAQGTATGVSTGIRALKNIENAPFKLLTQAIADIEMFLTTDTTKGQFWGTRKLGLYMIPTYKKPMEDLKQKFEVIKKAVINYANGKATPVGESDIDAQFTNEDWTAIKDALPKDNAMVEGYNILDEMQKGHMSCLRRLHTNITKTLQIDPKDNMPKWNTHRPPSWNLAAAFIKDILKEDRHVGGKNTRKKNNKSKQTKKSRRH